MKEAFKIYKNDMKNIFKNYGALIVVIALCILPSLYAWFNIGIHMLNRLLVELR